LLLLLLLLPLLLFEALPAAAEEFCVMVAFLDDDDDDFLSISPKAKILESTRKDRATSLPLPAAPLSPPPPPPPTLLSETATRETDSRTLTQAEDSKAAA